MVKLDKGTLGKPKLKIGDVVAFYCEAPNKETFFLEGTVEIVDSYGTFFQAEEPSYDIMVKSNIGKIAGPVLVKHIEESACYV